MHRVLLATAAILAVPLAMAGSANAVPTQVELTLQSGAATNSQTGTLISGMASFGPTTVGNFTASNIGTSLTNPDFLDLSSIDVASSTGGTLIITVTGTGFTTPLGASNWLSQLTGNISAGPQGSGIAVVSAKTYIDNSDTLLKPGCVGCTLLSTLSLGGHATAAGTTDGSFALAEVITITTTDAERLSLDASLSNVPEPISLSLLGSALLGLGLARKQRAAS